MKAAVIGLGSMGRRRTRLLQAYDGSIKIAGIDMREERRDRAKNEFGIDTYEDIKTACEQQGGFDVAFVATSPLSHAQVISECLGRGMHVFTEINLVSDGYEENMKLAKDKALVLFLSSTPMYRKETHFIKDAVRESDSKKSYIYHVGQYLPDWHPWEGYKDFFVGDKRTDACREIMAIEFPWLFDIFGRPVRWDVQKSKNSGLDIDYPDTYRILFEHFGGNSGTVHIDVVSRKAVRSFECIAEDLYISWDGTPDGLKRYDPGRKEDIAASLYDDVDKRPEYSASIIENAYLAEIEEFMGVIKGVKTPGHSFEEDRKILSVIDDIEGI